MSKCLKSSDRSKINFAFERDSVDLTMSVNVKNVKSTRFCVLWALLKRAQLCGVTQPYLFNRHRLRRRKKELQPELYGSECALLQMRN